jgi:hypothetical protein
MRIGQIIVLCILASVNLEAFAAPVALKKSQLQRIALADSQITCGYFKKSWKVVKKVGKKFSPKPAATEEQTAACAALLKPGSAKRLAQFPSAATLIKSATNTNSLVNISAVSGTPPTLAELVDQGGDAFYWRPGVLNTIATGSPDETTCNELFGSSTDGNSSGWGGCNLTQSVGYSVGEIARAGTSMCYMKNAGSADGAASGAITIDSGSVPGGVKNLFSTPSGSNSRLIKVTASGEGSSTMFIRVFSAAENEAAGNQYKFEFWACEGDETPQEFESTRITAGGQFISQTTHTFDGGSSIGQGSISGFLSREGAELIFDPTRDRTAQFTGLPGQGGSFKSSIVINGENQVFTKVSQDFGSSIRKGYSVARFDGTGLTSLRFYEGAFKEEHSFGTFSGGLEFRDTAYLSSPGSAYVALLDSVDFSSDSFYTANVSTPTIPARARCNADADVEVTMDMSNEFMQQIASECEGERIDGEIQICSSDSINQAMEQFPNACGG